MRLKDLISILNMNITFNLIDYWSRQPIDYHNTTRKELREIKSRKIYLIMPTDEKNHLEIILY